jgi:hypothetical protein
MSGRETVPTIAIYDGSGLANEDSSSPIVGTYGSQEAEKTLARVVAVQAVAQNDTETLSFALLLASSLKRGESTAPITNELDANLINTVDVTTGKTLLHLAALRGSTQCARMLLENGALVHMRDDLDHTALYYVGETQPLRIGLTSLHRLFETPTSRLQIYFSSLALILWVLTWILIYSRRVKLGHPGMLED